jgi:hypothetical protein
MESVRRIGVSLGLAVDTRIHNAQGDASARMCPDKVEIIPCARFRPGVTGTGSRVKP